MAVSAGNISASEIVGTLNTGLESTAGNNVAGTVIVSPIANPVAGNYSAVQNIKLVATGSLVVRYTVDGANPTCATGIEYSTNAPILVNKSQIIKAIACYANNHYSPVAEFSYVVNVSPVSSSNSSSSAGGGPSGGAPAVNKITPQVKGASTSTDDVVQKSINQMTRAEKLAKIAEIRLLLIQLIQQLIIELQKQLLAVGK